MKYLEKYDHYNWLLQLAEKSLGIGKEYDNILKRLISGYHGTQYFFHKILKRSDLVADVGCYFGYWSYPLLENASKVYFIDKNDTHFQFLNRIIHCPTRVGGGGKSEVLHHDFTLSPLNCQFDLILCMGTLEYVDPNNLETFCANLSASLKPGGYFFIDSRETIKKDVWCRYILRMDDMLGVLYPRLLRDLGAPPISNYQRIKMIIRYIKGQVRSKLGENLKPVHKQKIKRLLGRETKIGPSTNKGLIDNIMMSLGLEEVDCLEDYIDPEVYEFCRGIEGFNLTNTFVGNYFFKGLYTL